MRTKAVQTTTYELAQILARILTVLATAVWLLPSATAGAQGKCRVLCDAVMTFQPSVIVNHLISQPRVRSLTTGAEQTLKSSSNVELIFAVSAVTPVPRLSVYGSVQWIPNASEKKNPFTLYTASDIGSGLRANAPTASAGLSYAIIKPRQTQGVLELDAHVGDLYSGAARPSDVSSYTHKLDLGLLGAWSVFNELPRNTYMHGVTLVTLLDYVATGLPRAGDEVPKGERVFLTSVHSASLIAGLAVPLTSR